MGNDNKAPAKPVVNTEDSMMEAIINMRMTQKQFERQGAKAEKEQQKEIQKAKIAVQKGNDEAAKMYLQIASKKQQLSLNMIRMSQKLENVQNQMKMAQGNADMVQQLNKIAPFIAHHAENLPIEDMYAQMTNFESAMDSITVQQKVMEGIMYNNTDINTDMAIDGMLNQLKQEHAVNISNNLNANNQQMFKNVQQNNMMYNGMQGNQVQESKQL